MELVKRVCTAYNKSILINENVNYQNESMWINWILPKLKNTLDDIINNNNNKTLYNLSNPSTNFLCFGFDDMYYRQNPLFNTFLECKKYNNEINIGIINLCMLIGIIRLYNPEGGECQSANINVLDLYNIEDLLIKLDNYFGFKIDFPNIFDNNEQFNWLFYVNYYKDLQNANIITEEKATNHWLKYGKNEGRYCNGEIGLITSRGIIKMRSVHSLYFMVRLKQILKNNIVNSTILEIGGGLGRNAYYAKKMGVKKYIIIDLPSSCIMSSYYLGKTLNEDNITLFGEDTDNYAHILPINSYIDNKVDIIIQFDGLTEMGLINSQNYINNFKKISPLFLSINHEANKYIVQDLYINNIDIECIHRIESSYRKGYIEELLK